MGLYFKGQGQSGLHSPGSYTVMRPIRRLPQGGIQSLSFSVSPSLSPSLAQIPPGIKPHIVLGNDPHFYKNLKNNKYSFSLSLAVGCSCHMTLFPQPGKMAPLWVRPLVFTHITLPHCLLCPVSPSLRLSQTFCISFCSSLPPFFVSLWFTPISPVSHIRDHTHKNTCFDSHSGQQCALLNLDWDKSKMLVVK